MAWLLSASCASAQRPAEAVTAAYRLLEKSIREGDGDLWLRLQSRETLAGLTEQMKQSLRKGRRADASVRYEPILVHVQKNEAVVIGRLAAPSGGRTQSYHRIMFLLEDGAWKVGDERWSETPIAAASAYAALPPEDDEFLRAGAPWRTIPYANLNTKSFKPSDLPWKMQATQDESFLYLRFEAASPLPPAGSEVQKPAGAQIADTGVPPGPPVILVKIASPSTNQKPPSKMVELQAGAVVQTRSTFDQAGKANSNRYFVQYSLQVRGATVGVRAGDDLFDSSTTDRLHPLIAAASRYLDMRIPLQALGVDGARRPRIDLQEFNSLPQILPYQVSVFADKPR